MAMWSTRRKRRGSRDLIVGGEGLICTFEPGVVTAEQVFAVVAALGRKAKVPRRIKRR